MALNLVPSLAVFRLQWAGLSGYSLESIDMLHQGKVKRGYLNWFSFYVALVLLLVVLLEVYKYGNNVTESMVQGLSVLAFYGFVALCLRLDNGDERKRKESDATI